MNNYWRYFFISVVCVHLTRGGFFPASFDKVVNLKYARVCPDITYNDLINLNLLTRKFNRTHTSITANATVTAPFDKSYVIEAEASIWRDGGWRNHAIKIKKDDACNTLHFVLGHAWEKVLKAAGVSTTCPVPPGIYDIEDYSMDLSNLPFLYTTGQYLGKALITKNNAISACVVVELDVTATPRL